MPDPSPVAQATVKQGRRLRFSYVWIAPVIAAAVGGYFFYKSEIDVGPTITIVFDQGTNISKGAKVEYRGVQVGAVQSVELDASLGHVNVEAQLDKPATGLAREGSQFWVVKPQVGLGEITGLSTLLSGSYIQVAPGGGDKTTHFVGLPEPPVVTAGETDLSLILESDDVGSLQVDTPILYRGINVGAVTAITLPDVDSRIRIDIAIRGDHASLVRTNSVFWRVSGIHTSFAGLDPTIDIASLASLVRGGISFATPEEPGDPASANAVFELLDDPPDAVEIELPQDGLKLVLTAERAGIAEDAPVYYRELPVGKVLQSRLNKDASAIEIEVLIEPAHASLVNTNSVFWNASGVQIDLDLTDPKIDIELLKALLIGGIAFATRGAAGEPVKAGDTFLLHDRQPAEDTGGTASGRRFILVADELGSITVGDPIYYRQVQVGKVAQTELIPDGSAVAVSILIDEAHASLVQERSVFWNASGIHADLSLLDPSIDVELAKALLGGGIAFATPAGGGGAPAPAGTEFRLYSEEEGRNRTQPAAPGLHVLLSADELGSVAVGDPVYYREVEVGAVTAVGFEDGASVGARARGGPPALRAAGPGGLGVLERERLARRLRPVQRRLDRRRIAQGVAGGRRRVCHAGHPGRLPGGRRQPFRAARPTRGRVAHLAAGSAAGAARSRAASASDRDGHSWRRLGRGSVARQLCRDDGRPRPPGAGYDLSRDPHVTAR